jgi:hypothetical protein
LLSNLHRIHLHRIPPASHISMPYKYAANAPATARTAIGAAMAIRLAAPVVDGLAVAAVDVFALDAPAVPAEPAVVPAAAAPDEVAEEPADELGVDAPGTTEPPTDSTPPMLVLPFGPDTCAFAALFAKSDWETEPL